MYQPVYYFNVFLFGGQVLISASMIFKTKWKLKETVNIYYRFINKKDTFTRGGGQGGGGT